MAERTKTMAHIKKITFDRVPKNYGCQCDRCGQYIQNIWTVQYTDGITLNYGIDCFEKLYKSGNLNQYGIKLLKKAIKWIEYYSTELKKWQSGEYTEENCIKWQYEQSDKESAWYGQTFEEYKQWQIEKWFPARLADQQKEIDRLSKANFNR